ncbi:F0F1 ATP synthase subunit A [uncultured Clostridium sp.]|uniref:F0F1 ATP synthase subunit A n=1 Tax=uncultured Clostridium sp. TaxID=59620 RepID=UPI0028EC5CB4|nr:F0F1 ATP synthase subunit A [uncultured Clostridium sp.]
MKMDINFLLFGKEICLNASVINSWMIVIVLSIFSIIVGRKIKNTKIDEKPSSIVTIVEFFVETVESLVKSTMGENRVGFAPYIGTISLFLVFANLLGLLGLQVPTSDYSIVLALAMITFVLIHFNSISSNGIKDYLKSFTQPTLIMLPINLMSEITIPIALSFRLFGNMISGTIIIALIFNALNSISIITVPFIAPLLNAYFDVFVGLVQTFIFAMLTMVFISNKMKRTN